MRYLDSIPKLITPWLNETIDFYQNILGFSVKRVDENWGFASLFRDNINIMLVMPDARFPFNTNRPFLKPSLTGSIYFYIDDVDELWEHIKNEVTVYYPPQDFEYGMREFAIYDNNGYLLQFGQETINEKTAFMQEKETFETETV